MSRTRRTRRQSLPRHAVRPLTHVLVAGPRSDRVPTASLPLSSARGRNSHIPHASATSISPAASGRSSEKPLARATATCALNVSQEVSINTSNDSNPVSSPMASIPGITAVCVIPRPGLVTTITTAGASALQHHAQHLGAPHVGDRAVDFRPAPVPDVAGALPARAAALRPGPRPAAFARRPPALRSPGTAWDRCRIPSTGTCFTPGSVPCRVAATEAGRGMLACSCFFRHDPSFDAASIRSTQRISSILRSNRGNRRGRLSSCRKRPNSNSRPRLVFRDLVFGFRVSLRRGRPIALAVITRHPSTTLPSVASQRYMSKVSGLLRVLILRLRST